MGISSILSLLAFVGVVIFLAGIGMAVMSASQGRPVARGGLLLSALGLVAAAIFGVISQGVVIVQPNEVAVVFNSVSGNLETPRLSGTHIVIPVINQVTIYPISQQQYTMTGGDDGATAQADDAVRARTIDGQEVRLDVSLLFGVDPAQVNLVHQRWQNRYVNDFIRPTARGIVRDVVSRYRADEIYGERRGEMEAAIEDIMGIRMGQEGLILTDLLVRDINFSEQFTQAIEQAQIAEQEANRARLRVQQIQQEAEQARAQARGQRDATIARAEGDAQSIILRAQAEAEALRLVSEQIAANPILIQYQYIQNLSDNVRLMMVPSNSPFLFDFASLGVANPDFVAPDVPEPNELNLITESVLPVVPEITPTPAPGN
ncbi:prohibitin family protein [Anaerolineae bacterium CFX9]|jgi:regulator of protease activity HflC (stomatin/prohibitin superfamily)|nr:prohibitin family protein [Anaerolineae bacterium CFX9]